MELTLNPDSSLFIMLLFCWDSLEEKKQGHFKDKIMCKNVVGGGWGVVAVPLGSIRPQEARAKDLGGPNAKQT